MPNKTEHRPVWNKNNTFLFILLIVSAGMIYFLPAILSRLLFLPFLIMAWRSKRDFIWIAFLIILLEHPNGFFSGSTRDDLQRVPLYSFGHGFSFMFQELLIFVLIFKSFLKHKINIILNDIEKALILILTAFLIIVGLIWGAGFSEIVSTARMLIPYSFVFLLPRLFPEEKQFVELAGLLFPLVFFILIGQIYEMTHGAPIVSLIKKGATFSQYLQLDDNSVSAARVIESTYLLFMTLVFSLFFFFSKKKYFPKSYLIIIVAISNLAIVLTATRGWMIAFFLMTGLMFILNSTKLSVRSVIVILASLLLLYNFAYKNQKISKQVSLSFERFSTMQALAKGDITAKGTLARLNVRGPRVMRKFKESPFVGIGFSKEYFEYKDFHVGNQSMLLNMGAIGFAIWMGIYLLLIYKTFLRRQSLTSDNPYKAAFLILPLSLIGILGIHSTSTQWLGYAEAPNKIVTFSIILMMATIYYNKTQIAKEAEA